MTPGHVIRTRRIGLEEAWRAQAQLADRRRTGEIADVIWLLEHDPVYTTGRHGDREDLWLTDAELEQRGARFVRLDRGGQMTWHGPGQTTAYVIADLRGLGLGSVRRFVTALVEGTAAAARTAGVRAEPDLESHGAYVDGRKIGSVGIRVSGGVSLHGVALNRDPDLGWLTPMTACGAPGVAATSIESEGGDPSRSALETTLLEALAERLGIEPAESTLAALLPSAAQPSISASQATTTSASNTGSSGSAPAAASQPRSVSPSVSSGSASG